MREVEIIGPLKEGDPVPPHFEEPKKPLRPEVQQARAGIEKVLSEAEEEIEQRRADATREQQILAQYETLSNSLIAAQTRFKECEDTLEYFRGESAIERLSRGAVKTLASGNHFHGAWLQLFRALAEVRCADEYGPEILEQVRRLTLDEARRALDAFTKQHSKTLQKHAIL